MTYKRLCPECGEGVINEGAHAEACPGPVSYETAVFQCGACLRTERRSVWCCGRWMGRVHTGVYHHPKPSPL